MQWYHRCFVKLVGVKVQRDTVSEKQKSQFVCIIATVVWTWNFLLSANVTESAAWFEVSFP